MNMKQEPKPVEMPTHFLGVPAPFAVISGFSSAATLLIRYGEGLLGVGRNGLFAVVVMVCYGLAAPCPSLLVYCLVFIALVVAKRLVASLCHACGYRQNSGFEGYPLLCLIGLPYGFCKQLIEPGLIYWLGWWLRFSDPALGWFFIASAAASAIKAALERVQRTYRDLTADDLRFQMERDARRRASRGW